jgi:hypothetical protein
VAAMGRRMGATISPGGIFCPLGVAG